MSRNSSCSHVQSSPFARRFGCTSAATTSTRSTSSCVVLASSLNSNTMISRRVPVVNFGLSHSFRIELCYGVSEFHKDRVELRPAQESAGSRARTAQYSRNGRLPGRCARPIIIQLSPNMLDQFLEAVKVGSVWAHGSSISPTEHSGQSRVTVFGPSTASRCRSTCRIRASGLPSTSYSYRKSAPIARQHYCGVSSDAAESRHPPTCSAEIADHQVRNAGLTGSDVSQGAVAAFGWP
jgi:hypothetical protein